jgi:hypothetical protein
MKKIISTIAALIIFVISSSAFADSNGIRCYMEKEGKAVTIEAPLESMSAFAEEELAKVGWKRIDIAKTVVATVRCDERGQTAYVSFAGRSGPIVFILIDLQTKWASWLDGYIFAN